MLYLLDLGVLSGLFGGSKGDKNYILKKCKRYYRIWKYMAAKIKLTAKSEIPKILNLHCSNDDHMCKKLCLLL